MEKRANFTIHYVSRATGSFNSSARFTKAEAIADAIRLHSEGAKSVSVTEYRQNSGARVIFTPEA
jgi:hypothetical protein